MSVLNPLCSVWALRYANPSLLAPFGGLTLVWVICSSRYMTEEIPTKRQVVGAGVIVLAEIIVTITGDHTTEDTLTLAR